VVKKNPQNKNRAGRKFGGGAAGRRADSFQIFKTFGYFWSMAKVPKEIFTQLAFVK